MKEVIQVIASIMTIIMFLRWLYRLVVYFFHKSTYSFIQGYYGKQAVRL